MITNKLNNYGFTKNQKILFFLTIFSGSFLISFTLNNDLWFLLNSGRHVLTYGIPHIEPFTIHPDMKFLMQQWLTAVIFWYIYSNWSAAGLIVLLFLTYIVTVFIIYRLCMLISNENFQISVFVTMGIGILISLFMQTRPQIFSTLFLTFALYCLELYIKKLEIKYLFPLPILSLLLINFHAALWMMQFILILPYIADSFSFKRGFIRSEGYPTTPLFLCITCMVVLGFFNPYGTDAMTYLFRSYGHENINTFITEMEPLNIGSLSGKIGFGTIIFPFLCYAFYKKRIPKLRYLLLTLGMGYLAMSSVRGLFLFWICGLFPLAYVFKDCIPLKTTLKTPTPQIYRLRKHLIVLLSLSLAVLYYHQYNNLADKLQSLSYEKTLLLFTLCGILPLLCVLKNLLRKKSIGKKITKEYCLNNIAVILIGITAFPLFLLNNLDYNNAAKEAPTKPSLDYLLEKNQPEDIILWVGYNHGGYAEFRGIASYLDPRAEVFLASNNGKKDIFDEYIALTKGTLHYREFVERYSFTHFLTTKLDILYTYLYHDDDYVLIFEDEYCRLFEKKRQ